MTDAEEIEETYRPVLPQVPYNPNERLQSVGRRLGNIHRIMMYLEQMTDNEVEGIVEVCHETVHYYD